ncbi:MAG TPA: plastocyanin/azurin family copper-binding protein [Candidatus Limnocylindria bacterium]|nr:plastocyanin/azurin family copper-binding protein [Candidatus Limnocylindria bacterium]
MSFPFRHLALVPCALLAALALAACASGGGPSWTFAPLGPTPQPGSPGASPGQSPGGSPGASPGNGEVLQVTTTQEDPLAFEPNQLSAPAGTEVTVVYLNDSNVLHNIHFYAGPDRSAESLGATELVTGPGAEEQLSFTTPEEPGDYFFVCDVHPDMTGTLTVEE